MGTRADFYIGSDEKAEWLGSVAWDGDEWLEDSQCALTKTKTSAEFRDAVDAILSARDDATTPEQGWPWPWEDSRTTDYAYCFNNGSVEYYCFGRPIFHDDAYDDDEDRQQPKRDNWPNMEGKQNVTRGKRSGVLIFTGPKEN